jgi:hypothetical protein
LGSGVEVFFTKRDEDLLVENAEVQEAEVPDFANVEWSLKVGLEKDYSLSLKIANFAFLFCKNGAPTSRAFYEMLSVACNK